MKRFLARHAVLSAAFAFVLLALAAGARLLVPGAVLSTQDQNYGYTLKWQNQGRPYWLRGWNDEICGLADSARIQASNWPNLLSARGYINWFQFAALASLGFFTALYLRGKKVRWSAALFGGVLAAWLGTNFSLLSAGHFGKYGGLFFLGPALWAVGKLGETTIPRRRRVLWGMVAAACVVAMFLEQLDTGLFFGTFLFPLALYELVRAETEGPLPRRLLRALLVALPAAAVAAVGILGPISSAFASGQVDNLGGADKEEAPEAAWDYLTQWSQPPDESFDFVAPGWMGWGSGDPSGPYHGRVGQTAHWDETHQGFLNYRTETVYLSAAGAMCIAFLAWLLVTGRTGERKGLALLWLALLAATLVLSWGKYTPLYRLVAALPGFGSIRNPNKWIHVFQLAWGVCAAFGLDGLLQCAKEERPIVRRWAIGAAGLAALAFLFSFVVSGGAAKWTVTGWPLEYARAIASTRAASLAGLAVALAAFALAAFAATTRRHAFAGWFLAAFVAGECLFWLAPRYVRLANPNDFAANPLTAFLKEAAGVNRVAIPVMNDAFLGRCPGRLFPAQGIETTAVTAMPRPPAAYLAFEGARIPPLVRWDLQGVTHLLLPEAVARQWLSDPAAQEALRTVCGVRVSATGVVRGDGRTPTHAVLEIAGARGRAALVPAGAAKAATPEEALERMAAPGYDPHGELLLSDGDVPEGGARTIEGSVEPVLCIRGESAWRVLASDAAYLRLADAWDPGWKAWVDGERKPVLRADYLFSAIRLEPGEHVVVFRHDAAAWELATQIAALLAGLVAAILLGGNRFRPSACRADGVPGKP
ncbi:MAG: hypothetical protein IJS32_03040 [Kiritimatiellae bacterium]|nr:hypothetical protein [Kiritimatiellia bacterium]